MLRHIESQVINSTGRSGICRYELVGYQFRKHFEIGLIYAVLGAYVVHVVLEARLR